MPPPPVLAPYLPFANLPSVPLDEARNGVGVAQGLARAKGLQGRLLWIDATANLDAVNTPEKIIALVGRIQSAGFNTIVFDVKPIVGETLYPSKYATKMSEWVRPWKTSTLPRDFDPLKQMAATAREVGMSLIVSLNAFSEGHREFPKRGPGWEHPEWQTTLYDVAVAVRPTGSAADGWPVHERPNDTPRRDDDLALYTDLDKLPAKLPPGATVALLDSGGSVIALVDGAAFKSLGLKLPTGGAALVASTAASGTFLKSNATPGQTLERTLRPVFVPIGERAQRQVPLMTNPHAPEVRTRLLGMVTEMVTNYPIDGIVFDDRLRYAGIDADFSPATRTAFEAYVGRPVTAWPDDVYRYEVGWPGLNRRVVPGPLYDAWLVFRALNLRNFVADVVKTAHALRPEVVVGTYVGSWYPDYPDLGANWAADDLPAGYRFLNESYKRTGWASLVDFVITGCYYPTAAIQDAAERGISIGETVEAAGQFSNRALNDQSVAYAGISLERFKGKPDELKRVLQAAAATTQGIMVFDLSHEIAPFWPVFAEAFSKPAVAPHAVPAFLKDVRAEKAKRKAAGIPDPPVIQYRGASGTGF